MINWSLDIGNILTILTIVAGGIGFMYTTKLKLDDLSARLLDMEKELRKLIDVLIQQGKHEERMTAMDARIVAQGMRLDDLTQRFNHQADRA